MSVSTMIANDVCVNMPGGEVTGGKEGTAGAPARPQQRFADILPLAGAMTMPTADKNTASEASSGLAKNNAPTDTEASKPKGTRGLTSEGNPVPGVGPVACVPPGLIWDVKKAGLAPGIGKGGNGDIEGQKPGVHAGHKPMSPASPRAQDGTRTARAAQAVQGGAQRAGKTAPDKGSSSEATVLPHGAGRLNDIRPNVAGAARGAPGSQGLPDEAKAGPGRPGRRPVRSNPRGEVLPAAGSMRHVIRSDSPPGAFSKNETASSASTAGRESVRAVAQFAFAAGAKGAASVPGASLSAPVGEVTPLSQHLALETQVGAGGATAENPPQSVGEQILDSLRASLARGDNEVVVRLHPPELGTVLVRFREHGEHISGLLEVSRNDTRYEIEQVLPPVLRNLQEAGIQIERLEVVVSGQPERDFARGQPQQDAWPQQQDGSNQDRHFAQPASWADSHRTGTDYPIDSEETRADGKPGVTRGRINMLL